MPSRARSIPSRRSSTCRASGHCATARCVSLAWTRARIFTHARGGAPSRAYIPIWRAKLERSLCPWLGRPLGPCPHACVWRADLQLITEHAVHSLCAVCAGGVDAGCRRRRRRRRPHLSRGRPHVRDHRRAGVPT
eukprot:3443235-Prymnesium_polylepis.1